MVVNQRIINFLICLDQLIFNIITLGSSSPDETMSAAAYRLEQDGKLIGKIFRPLIDYMFFFDPKHCEESYKSEFEKKQLPTEYRRE